MAFRPGKVEIASGITEVSGCDRVDILLEEVGKQSHETVSPLQDMT